MSPFVRRTDRRGFLAAGAATLLAWSAAARRRPDPRPPIRKALKLSMIRLEGGGLVDRLRAAREAGFEGVEPELPQDGLAPEELLAAGREAGVVFPGVVDAAHWSRPLNHPDPEVRRQGVRALEQALRAAAALGAESVLLVPAVVGRDLPYDEAWRLSREGIRAALPLAEELGVAIAIENVWNHFLLSPLEAARYVDSFESPFVRFHFDVGNVVRFGWPEQWIRILGRRIVKLDIKEYDRERAEREGSFAGFGAAIGEGDVDWKAVRAALAEIGFSGWASAEVPGGGPARLREISERMDRVLGL